jgi:hypothetical protein
MQAATIRRTAFDHGQFNEKYFLRRGTRLIFKFKRYGFDYYLLSHIAVTHYRERSLMTKPTFSACKLAPGTWNVIARDQRLGEYFAG